MAETEHGEGILLSVDTERKTLRFQEVRHVAFTGRTPPKEWEHPYALEWEAQQFSDLVGKVVEYVLSDSNVVSLKAAS